MSKTRNKLKLTGLLLTVVMIVSLLGAFSLTASAADDLTVTIDTGADVTLKDTDGDGYYEIENADGLYAFSAAVNGGNTAINGKLTADIVVNVNVLNADGNLSGDGNNFRVWTPIGNFDNRYSGIFDGESHTVSGLYFNNPEQDYVALFGHTDSGGKVQNVGVIDSYFNARDYVAGVVGFNNASTITNCYNTGSVNGVNNVGGVLGRGLTIKSSGPQTSIIKCHNTGSVSGSQYVGGVVGEAYYRCYLSKCYNIGSVRGTSDVGGVAGTNYYTIYNSYNTGSVNAAQNVGGVVGNSLSNSTIRDCYYNSSVYSGDAIGKANGAAINVLGKTTEQFASGEVAYLLGESFGQTIVTEAYPSLGGAKVYYGYTSCADDAVKVYTNIPADDTKPEHSGNITYEVNANDNTKHDKKYSCCNKVLIEEHTGGTATCVAQAVCAHCGTSYGEVDTTNHDSSVECVNGFCPNGCYEPATLNAVGYYEIDNAGKLFWFAQEVNVKGNREIKGVLTAHIDLENRPWTPIGSTGEENNNFRGVFDGQNYTIKGLYVEGSKNGVGFFGEVRTGTVKNFTIYGNVVVNTEVDYVGGVIGSICGVNGETDLERNGAIIQNITSFVNVTAKAHGIGMIGGFVGYANHQSLIEQCAWYGTFDAGEYRVDSGAGGFIGHIYTNSSVTIRNCAAYGTIKTDYVKNSYNNYPTIYMGGFLSFSNTNAQTTLENCLFAGKFERGANLTDEARLGAFGTLRSVNAIKNCYYLGDDGLEAVHSDSDLKPGSDNVEITSVTGEALKEGTVATQLGEYWRQDVHYPIPKDTKAHSDSATYTYTDNGDGTHKKTCNECGYVEVYNEAHSGGTATCTEQAECQHCGASYGEVGGHSFDSTRTCTGCRIPAKAYLGAYDFKLNQYVITYYATLPEALAAVPHGTSFVGALADYNDDLVIDFDFDANGYTFDGDITVNASINEGGTFNGKVTINSGWINKATFNGEVIVKGNIEMLNATFNNTVTVETSGSILGMGGKFYKTVTNNGIIRGGDYHCKVINNGEISRNELEHPFFFGTVTNNGTIKGGYFDGAKLINAGTVEDHCSENYDYVDDFEYVQAEGGKVTGAHALTYTASGNVITATCSAKCGYVCTATVSAENATYNGTEQKTATITYSEGWIGEKPNVSYANNVNAGTATASITLGEATASVEFTIAKADPSVVSPELASGQVYTGLIFSPFSSLGSTTGGELQVQVNDREWASPNNYYISDAGTYRVGYRVVGNENYNNVEPVYFTLEIAKRDFSNPAHKVSAVLDAESFVYDGTAKKPAVTVTFDKCIDEDEGRYIGVKVTADNYIVSYSENVNAGTATVTITGTGTNCIGTITKTFKITKAPLTVTAENKTMTTGQPLPPFTYTISGFVNGETEDVLTAKPTVSCEADGQTVGTYNITTSGAAADNYEITYVNGTLSVVDHQHAWTYTADGDTLTATCATAATCPLKTATIKIAAEGKTYDGTPVTATLTGSIDGVVNPTVSYSGNTDAGTHTASITLGEATASVEFTIAKADSTLTAPNAITDLVYNGSNQSLVSAGSSTTGTVQYKLNDGEWSTNVPTATEAGEYTVYYKLVGDKNHKDVAEASVKVAILSKSAANAEVSFNGNLVYDGNAKTPEITVVFEQKELVPMKDYIVSCSNNVNAGTAAIEITFIGNYEGKVVKSFTIAPRQLVIFWENTNMIYNGNRQTPTAKLFGIIPGDEVGYTVSGWGKFGGTYTAKVEKLTNPNYVLPADATCRFTIDANPIEVAIDVAVDIYDIIPDSAKEAVANAAINAAENALNDAKNAATECINSAVDQITDCVSTKAQEAANAAKSLAGALCELWQNLCNRVSCFF